MFSSSPVSWRAHATPHPALVAACQLAARGLRRASAALERLAVHVATVAPRPLDAQDDWEFHADAGAPEGGALYVNGRLVGWLHGVQRL